MTLEERLVGSVQEPITGKPAPGEVPVTIIRPSKGWISLNFRELWEYRELLYFLTWRDIKVRYKQTVLGAAWAILQPFATMVVFSVVLGQLAGVPTGGLPYPVFIYCGLLPWQLFANSLSQSSMSLVANERLITKVYFPRLLVPISSVLSCFVDFLLSFTVFFGILSFYNIWPTWNVLALPILVLLTIVVALGTGLWLCALNIQYRDVRYTVSFLMQLWFFVTPVAYSSLLVPERYRIFLGLNPMAGIAEAFRWSLAGQSAAPWSMLVASGVISALVLVGGLYYFRRVERDFADLV